MKFSWAYLRVETVSIWTKDSYSFLQFFLLVFVLLYYTLVCYQTVMLLSLCEIVKFSASLAFHSRFIAVLSMLLNIARSECFSAWTFYRPILTEFLMLKCQLIWLYFLASFMGTSELHLLQLFIRKTMYISEFCIFTTERTRIALL